jgi:hypothetical protein
MPLILTKGITMKKIFAIALAFGLSTAANAGLITQSFTGDFDDNDARYYITFDVTADNTNVDLITWSYAGGVNFDNTIIADGGFDTQLFLFNSASTLLTSDDDASNVMSASGSHSYDAIISRSLNIGSYTAVLTQYDSDYNSGSLFTGNWDSTGRTDFGGRNANYAFDISGNDLANITGLGFNATPDVSVPEPTTIAILGAALLGLVARRKLQK